MDISGEDVLDEGLSRLAGTGPEFGGGLSNHGPMAAEALVRLGHAEAVETWLNGYIRRLDDAPRPRARISGGNWREALGDLSRVADWEAYFHAELAQAPWRDVLGTWWTRLAPGLAAGATHGIIRTSHAARGIAAAETAGTGTGQRVSELARGLAYWAARYAVVGTGSTRLGGTLDLPAAVRGLPRAAEFPRGGMISDVLAESLPGQPGFGAAAAALRPPADVNAALLDLAREFAGLFLTYGRAKPIGLLHAVTAPVAARSVLPLLPPEAALPTFEALWRVDAALYTVYGGGATPEPLPSGPAPAPDDLADRAVAAGDEHAIKLTEACLRIHAEQPDPVLLHAAARASELFRKT